MSRSLYISIADWPVVLQLEGCDEKKWTRLTEYYAAFTVPIEPAAFGVRVQVVPGEAFIAPELGSTWQIRSTARNGRIEFESHYEKGWADWTTGQAELVMRPNADPENFLRVLYAWHCLDEGSLLVHAAGVIRNGRGYVFFGASHSGKTTISRFSLDHTVLSDDLVIVKKQGDKYRVLGVPFRGEMVEGPRTNAAADLCGLFALKKDGEHHVAELTQSEQVARLAACVPFVMSQPANIARVTDVCADLAARVPIRELYFRRDSGFWSVIDGLE
ncbi:MAG: hypothetical protein HY782_09330 [Chloroflexi bacterium]|nr:hypothetical protein [Chloroflexota bacterium]